MELRQFRYFLAVAEELHFGRAAKRVHISQPPLSHQIRQLEEDLRIKLFYRTSRRVELTEAGRIFAGEARLILQQIDQAVNLAVEANRSKVKHLVVGCSPANSHVVLKILKLYGEQNPKIHLVLKSLVTLQQMEALRNGRIDVGFLTLPVDGEGLTVEPILQERLVVAMRRDHPLAARKRLPLRALANETLIVFPLYLSPGRFEMITSLCRNAGFSLHVIHEADNIHTMLDLVGGGFGVSLMRASVQSTQRSDVVFRDLQHSPIVRTGIAYRRGDRSEAVSSFFQVTKQAIRSSIQCSTS